jgi:transposase
MEDTLVCSLLATTPADLSSGRWRLRHQVSPLRLTPTSGASIFGEEFEQLRREVLELNQKVARLESENAEWRQQAGYWKAMHARAVLRSKELEAEQERLRGEIRKLQDQLFGRKSEKSSTHDRSNHLEGEDDDQDSSAPRTRGQQKGNRGPKRRDYSHLQVVEDPRELPEDQRFCPQCGAALSPSNTEDSEQIEIDVKAYRRRIRRRRYQRTCSCEDCPRTFTAPPAPKLIPKGLLGTSVWVELFIDKFYSHRPTERLLDQWRLLGLDLAPGTVTGGMERLMPLFEPLYKALLERNASSDFALGDETRWMVFIDLEGKTGHCWWLWVFSSNDTVVFRLDPSRSHEVPEGHFPDHARLVLMVDRYSAYKAMAQVKLGNILLVFCWAHVRRDFVKVGKGWPEHKEWALAWLRRIRDLYRHHRQRRESPASSAKFTAADTKLRQIVVAMQAQAEKELADPKLQTPCRKVLESLQEHWTGLTRFLDDLRIPLDNNFSERQARGPALGRKNYYGSGAEWSGKLAAMLFSIFATLRLAEINVRQWLTWYLGSCAENGGQPPADIDPFLPWSMSPEKRRAMALEPDDSS